MTDHETRCILVDAENLLGCPPELASDASWDRACAALLESVDYREESDRLVVGVGPDWVFEASARFPAARLVVRSGPSGADLALCEELADAAWIASHFSEVIVASGDHEFVASVWALRDHRVRVTVATLPLSAAPELTAAADQVLWLERPIHTLGESAFVAVADGMALAA